MQYDLIPFIKDNAMKRAIFFFMLMVFFGQQMIQGQSENWPVKAIIKSGKFIDIKAIDADGTKLDVVATQVKGDALFMDVKAVKGGVLIPIKMIVSNDFYVPVKAIDNGKIIDVKGITSEGGILDVKGVSRSGNTIGIAAFDSTEQFFAVKAVSPEGAVRDVVGVKFSQENVEIEIEGIQVLAHVKALPEAKVKSSDPVWSVNALSTEGQSFSVVALDDKGNEYLVKALVPGKNYQLLDIKTMFRRDKLAVKLLKEGSKVIMGAIDEFGRILKIKAKLGEGDYLDILGGNRTGNVLAINAAAEDGKLYPIKAISPDGDVYDVRGIKVTNSNVEGSIAGYSKSVDYFAHVKGFPNVQ
jgi:hypothetical protein